MKRNIWKGFWIIVFIFILVTVMNVAWAQQKGGTDKEKYGGILRIGVKGMSNLRTDTRYMSGLYRFNSGQQQMYEPLYTFGEKGFQELVPILAVNRRRVDDKTFLVSLRKGVKFHTGREMTAEDVKTNYDWLLNLPQGWQPITVQTMFTGDLRSVEVVDKYTVKFNLKRPTILFESIIVTQLGWMGIAPPEEIFKWGKDFAWHPVGTGPFKFVEAVADDRVVMERFDDYWGKKPYVDRVVFKVIPDDDARLIALQKGEIDIAHGLDGVAVDILKKSPQIKLYSHEGTQGAETVVFNLRKWPANDIRLRQAIAMGVDWDKIVVAAMPHEARPAYSFLAGTWASDQKEARRPTYDPVKAKKLVAEVVAKAGKPLPVLNAMVSDLPLDVSIFELAKTQLMEIGINVDVKVYPWTLFYSKWNDPEATQWDLVIIPNKSGSPLINFSILRAGTRATKDGKNWSAYVSPKLEEALEQAEVTVDSKESIQLFKEANRVALEDLPAFPTGLKIYYTGVQERVQDFKTHSAMIAISNPWTDIWLKK